MSGERRIRVTHVTTVPMSLMFLRGQTAFMRERGIDLSFVSSPGPELDAFGEEERAPVHGVPMERRITPLKDLASLARLYAHFRATEPDIVHAHTPKGGLLGTIAATFARVPRRIYHMRGLPLMGAKGPRRILLTLTERVSCALATEVLSVGESLRSEAIKEGLVRPERIHVLGAGSGQGVDTSRFDPAAITPEDRLRARQEFGIPEGALVCGFVGRIAREKGVHELATAWFRLRETLPSAHLLLIGPFEARDPIASTVRAQLERDQRVHLAGFRTDLPVLYSTMDCVVLPSHREGFPNVPLEAAAMNRPVVATHIVGNVDVIHDGHTGTLVPPHDPQALRYAIHHYLANPEVGHAHGAAARAMTMRLFCRDNIHSDIESYYRAPNRPRTNSRLPHRRAATCSTQNAEEQR